MSTYCTTQDVKDILDISVTTYDAIIEMLCEAVSDLIDAECGQGGGRLWYETIEELFDMKAGGYIDAFDSSVFSNVDAIASAGVNSLRDIPGSKYFPERTPVVTVSGVYTKDSGGAWVADTKDVYAYKEYIAFDCPYSCNKRQGLKIDYVAGFFDEHDVPKGLRTLTAQIVADEYTKNDLCLTKYVKSKKIGGYSIATNFIDNKFGKGTLLFEEVLKKYRREINYGSI